MISRPPPSALRPPSSAFRFIPPHRRAAPSAANCARRGRPRPTLFSISASSSAPSVLRVSLHPIPIGALRPPPSDFVLAIYQYPRFSNPVLLAAAIARRSAPLKELRHSCRNPSPRRPPAALALCKDHHWAMERNLIAASSAHHRQVSKIFDSCRSNGEKELMAPSGRSCCSRKIRLSARILMGCLLRYGSDPSPCEGLSFIFLGPAAELISYEGNRPISMVWRLEFDAPAELFEIAGEVSLGGPGRIRPTRQGWTASARPLVRPDGRRRWSGRRNAGQSGWPCQKPPWTKMTVRYLGRTRSGLPGRERLRAGP